MISSSTCWTWAPPGREPASNAEDLLEGRDRSISELKWTATRVDLIFASAILGSGAGGCAGL